MGAGEAAGEAADIAMNVIAIVNWMITATAAQSVAHGFNFFR
jgi:hypothetical protein